MLPTKLDDLITLSKDCLPIGIACLIKKWAIETFDLFFDGEPVSTSVVPNRKIDIWLIENTIQDMINKINQEWWDSKLTIVLHGEAKELSIILN